MTKSVRLPDDLIGKILGIYWDFQIQAAIQRTREFKENLGSTWSLVLSDIRDNVPSYRVRCINYQGLHISVFFRQPDCDIRGFKLKALFNSWNYTVERAALSLPRSLAPSHN